MNEAPGSRGLGRFISLYGSANAGAFIAFVPLLSLILPLKAEQIDPDNKLLLLSTVLFVGAIMASIANIAAGWLSDWVYRKWESRLSQITLGIMAVISSYFAFWKSGSWSELITSILLFQLSFNILFSPLGALLADQIPHAKKGLTAAVLNLGMPAGTIFIAFLTLPFFETEASRLIAISLVTTALIIPLLIFARSKRPQIASSKTIASESTSDTISKSDLVFAWIGRLSVQFSGAVLFGYLLYYLQDIVQYSVRFPDAGVDQGMGKLTLVATPTSVILGMMLGMWSDRVGLRRPFMILAAMSVSISMTIMALWPSWEIALIAYIVFATGLAGYLTLDAALVAQILAKSSSRARILGYMNLTNTIPAILTPLLAIILSRSGLQSSALVSLMLIAAALTLTSVYAVSKIKSVP